MKRILYCEGNVDGTVGGSYYSLLSLVTRLDKHRFSPLVVFYHDNYVAEMLRQAGVETRVRRPPATSRIAQLPMPQRARYLLADVTVPAITAMRFLRQERIDLVHLNNSVESNHSWMVASRLAGVPCITHERSCNPRFSRVTRRLARRMAKIICVSQTVRDNLLRQGIGLYNSVTIYNGIDPAKVQATREAATVRHEWGVQSARPVIGLVGNIVEWKGQRTVVEAVARLKRSFPDIVCLFVGDTSAAMQDYAAELRRRVTDLDVASNVIFTGYQKHVADLVNIMDVVLHASVEPEPFGRVIVEAMVMGKPVVGSRAGGAAEIIVEGVTGRMFTPGDAEELAGCVAELVHDPERARRMGEAGRQRVDTEFHIRRNVERTVAIYDSLLHD